MDIRERYSPHALGVDGSMNITNGMGGFLAKITGTITITDASDRVLVDAVPVTAGLYTPIPISVNNGATVQLAGGAAGTLMV